MDGFLKEFVSSAQKDQQVGGQRGNNTRLVARVGSRLVARDARLIGDQAQQVGGQT